MGIFLQDWQLLDMYFTVINVLALEEIFVVVDLFVVYFLCIKGGGSHDFKKQKFQAQTGNLGRGVGLWARCSQSGMLGS